MGAGYGATDGPQVQFCFENQNRDDRIDVVCANSPDEHSSWIIEQRQPRSSGSIWRGSARRAQFFAAFRLVKRSQARPCGFWAERTLASLTLQSSCCCLAPNSDAKNFGAQGQRSLVPSYPSPSVHTIELQPQPQPQETHPVCVRTSTSLPQPSPSSTFRFGLATDSDHPTVTARILHQA